MNFVHHISMKEDIQFIHHGTTSTLSDEQEEYI